ncbi:Uncharacterised protein [Vibrio cholerae]|nr:Uncharacterised protein [Vibrio cholerae]CSC93972.1 Uncharacterised protein [Vibrio cholerae]CSD18584.1 Uncharacterised protein [Vibrio cholerae]
MMKLLRIYYNVTRMCFCIKPCPHLASLHWPVQRAAICMMYQGKVISIFMAIMCINSVMVIRR